MQEKSRLDLMLEVSDLQEQAFKLSRKFNTTEKEYSKIFTLNEKIEKIWRILND